MGDDTRLLSAVLVGHVPSLGPTAFRSPFPPCTRCLSSTQPLSLTPCQGVTPLLLSLFFYLFLLFNILITGLSRPKAPSPLSEKQNHNLTWLFSQLIPTPSHLLQLSQCDPSKTGLCCLFGTERTQMFVSSITQKSKMQPKNVFSMSPTFAHPF